MKNFIKTTILFGFVIATSSCGGGGGGSSVTMDTMQTPRSPDLSAIGESSRMGVLSADQKLGSVTQSSRIREGATIDSISIKKDSSGNPISRPLVDPRDRQIFVDENGDLSFTSGEPIIDFTVENTVAGWEGSVYNQPASVDVLAIGVIADGSTFDVKSQYEAGDYYFVTGFWHRDVNDFGVFADGARRTEPLPTEGSATYNGIVAAAFWNNGPAFDSIEYGTILGDLEMKASFNSGNMQMNGNANFDEINYVTAQGVSDSQTSASPYFSLNFANTISNNDGGFIGGDVTCSSSGCINPSASSWGGAIFWKSRYTYWRR